MKRFYLVVGLLAPCVATPREQPWSFVESVGGIEVGAPRHGLCGVELPVVIDVAGLKAITRQPVAMNSALVCSGTHTKVRAHAIYLTIKTAPASQGKSSLCPPAQLGAIPSGVYIVYYGSSPQGAMRIGEISVAP
jgi:hypothetical protein